VGQVEVRVDLVVNQADLVVVGPEQDLVVLQEVETHLRLVHLKETMVELVPIVNQTLDVHLLKRVEVAVEQTQQEVLLLVHHQGQKLQEQEDLVVVVQLQDLL
tara:strand:+ start:109 stop:417 length:309 start_codon:yes stop_codon:yes gene_type:complete